MLTLQQRKRWADRIPFIAAGAAVAMTLACHELLYHPVAQHRAEVMHRLDAARTDVKDMCAAASLLPNVENEVEQLRLKMQQTHRLARHEDWGQFVRDVTKFGEDASLSKFAVHPGVPSRREMICAVPVVLSFEGDYVSVRTFLHHVEQMPRLTSINGLNLHVIEPVVGRVEAQVSMDLYFADNN